jgi:hypothetical protein
MTRGRCPGLQGRQVRGGPRRQHLRAVPRQTQLRGQLLKCRVHDRWQIDSHGGSVSGALVPSVARFVVTKISLGHTCSCQDRNIEGANVLGRCYQTKKVLSAQVSCAEPKPSDRPSVTLSIKSSVPPTAIGTTLVPLLGGSAASVTVTEGTPPTPVWRAGKYVPGVDGVTGATASASGIAIEHGSGTYSFVRTG